MHGTKERAPQLVLQLEVSPPLRFAGCDRRLQLGDLAVDRRHARLVRWASLRGAIWPRDGRPIMTSIQSGTELATSFIACTRDLKVSAM
jgi:hypothetical protein